MRAVHGVCDLASAALLGSLVAIADNHTWSSDAGIGRLKRRHLVPIPILILDTANYPRPEGSSKRRYDVETRIPTSAHFRRLSIGNR